MAASGSTAAYTKNGSQNSACTEIPQLPAYRERLGQKSRPRIGRHEKYFYDTRHRNGPNIYADLWNGSKKSKFMGAPSRCRSANKRVRKKLPSD